MVANSNFSRQMFRATFPRYATLDLGVLYPPVDIAVYEQYKPSQPRDPKLLVSLNRFERKKNMALAIRALAVVQRALPRDEFEDVKLVLAGGYDSNNTENLEHLHELQQEAKTLGLEKHVEFRTSVSDAVKKELLATAQAVLYTPSNEHFGIVPVEAMTYRTPVIAVNCGGPLETVANGETGFLCESTPDAFAGAILQLLGKENQKRVAAMGRAGQARAKALFSFETFTDRLYELVERMF